jgi:hypothetical protein
MEQNKLIERIKKLMALAADGSGASEAEAASASAKVQELLAEHNLEMSTFGGTGEGAQRGKGRRVGNAAYKHQRDLMAAIAEVNFCDQWVVDDFKTVAHGRQQKTKSYVIIGRQINIDATVRMFDYLMETIERIAPYTNAERMSKSALSWKLGCSERLQARLRERARRLRTESDAKVAASSQPTNGGTPGTALTLTNVYEAERAANYDARYGDGAWARRLARIADWEANREKHDAEWRAQAERREREHREWLESLTPAQLRKYQEKLKRAEERAEAKYEREWQREQAKIDRNAYWEGHDRGNDIGLDEQIERQEIKRLGN